MDKPLQFKYTKDGMLAVPGKSGDFISVNEMLGILNELINEKVRVLENYKDTDENSPEWNRMAKAKYEAQKAELERVEKLLY